MNDENKSSVGSIIGTIIIIALIVLGGLYFWGKRVEEAQNAKKMASEATLPTVSAEDQAAANEAASIKSTSSLDDLDSIESDLNNTNTTNLSPELDVQAQ